MKYIKTDWNIPYYNMAFENYVMNSEKFSDDYVFFYIHVPSIIIGKHQNALEEINQSYVRDKGIIVSRRNTGGGAVYHDGGNLNYSFIVNRKDSSGIDFEKYTAPVVAALRKLGIDASLSGRNDIMAMGRKISGNAQGHNRRKILHHGTLLFDVDIEAMVNALNVSRMKIESKAIKSVRSRVLNIREHLEKDMDIHEFRDFILSEIAGNEDLSEYVLDSEDIEKVEKLVREKYSTWDFNYGYSPKFSVTGKKRIDAVGIVEAGVSVKNGKIDDIAFSGDYFSEREGLENLLKGVRFSEESIRKALSGIDVSSYISGLDTENLVSIIFD